MENSQHTSIDNLKNLLAEKISDYFMLLNNGGNESEFAVSKSAIDNLQTEIIRRQQNSGVGISDYA
jgi:hypothetical protein